MQETVFALVILKCKMVFIFRWSGKWRRKQTLWRLNLAQLFRALLILWLALGSVLVLVTAEEENDVVVVTNVNSSTPKANSSADGGQEDSGEWEYYYEDEEDDAGVVTSIKNSNSSINNFNATNRSGNFLNSTMRHHDEFYYYMEEEVLMNNGTGPGKMVKTTTIKIDKTRKGLGSRNNKQDNLKSGSEPIFGIGAARGLVAVPSISPFKELATSLDVEGPVYTDYNYGHNSPKDYYYQYSGPDTALAKPLGIGEFPDNPFAEGEPVLLRPPSAAPTQPPTESGLELDVVKQVEYIDGVGDHGGSDDLNSAIYVDEDGNKNQYKLVQYSTGGVKPHFDTKLKVEAHASLTPIKNPIVKVKEFLYHLLHIFSHLSKAELILWVEKASNVIAELSVPKEHYLRVISFAGIYLFISMLTYTAKDVVDLVCQMETNDMPLKQWNYHAARRFVPARSVDPHLQERFLKLFRGEDDDEEDELSDLNRSSSSRSSEEDIADELDNISELCPKDAFFYSLNPKHIEAYTLIQQILVAQPTPIKFLHLARRLLFKENIHPKAWYFGVIGAFLARQDLTGFSVAHPLDAIPDWYIPADLIDDLMRSYKSIRVQKRTIRSTSNNMTTGGSSEVVASINFSPEQEGISLERLPLLNLPVKNDQGNFTVTLVTSEKKKKSVLNKALVSMNPTSSEEMSSNSIEIKESQKFIKGDSDEQKLIAKTSEFLKQNVNRGKGDTGDLTVKKEKKYTIKGSGKPNEFPLDSRGNDNDKKRNKKGKKGKKKKGKKKKGKCIRVNWRVGLDNGAENELWYWRESMMLNQHHWYWHATHHINATMHADRRGALFFFMHRSMVARYNAERLSNGMKRVQPLNFRQRGTIYPGYNSHLADINSGMYWTPRWPQTPLADIFHEHDPDFSQNMTLAEYNTLCSRLVTAIKTGQLMPANGPPLRISHMKGIDPLANTIEAADISVNPMYYDAMGIHGRGHIMIGLAADPDFRFRKVTGVMSEAAVSMRDPSFYSYHLFMDNIFELHKERLAPYEVVGGDFPLLWKGVKIMKIQLISQGGPPKNELRTFWSQHKFELSPGVDRSMKDGEKHAEVCSDHLDHEPFYFKIVIDRQPCVKSKLGQGTVRIFMAPRYDEKGRRIPIKIQRRLMFPLDTFTVKLKVGRNVITRYAEDSSLTQPWTKSLRELKRGPDSSGAADFCGCGWPQHLYIPKGHVAGMAFDLFVMVTNYDEDYVPNDPKILEIPETCNSPYIFCGLPRRRYPDKRPMGYPFDRPLFKSLNCAPGWTFSSVLCKSVNLILNRPIDTLEEYVSRAPNMAMLKFHIRHLNTFFPEPARH